MTAITVIGSVNLDFVATAARLPAPGETVTGATLARHPGGKGANQALAARRLGADVTLIARVGADAMADEALALLAAEGVDLGQCDTDSSAATGVALIAVAAGGENQIIVAPGANAAFIEPEALVTAQRAADVLLADTTSVVSEFVVQRKPVVTFRNRAPKPHMLDFDDPAQLPDLLSQAFDPPAPLRAAIAAYADAIHPWRDGRSSERVIDATEALLVRGLDSLARKPLGAWWRALQIRRELGYLRP